MERVFYIDPVAKSAGDGSETQPFATLEQGVLASRKCDGVRKIVLKAGKHVCPSTVILGDEDGGLSVVGEKGSILTGAKPLGKLNWEKHKNGILKASLCCQSFDRMFANGEEQILCRFPNRQRGVVPLEGAATPSQVKERVKLYQNPDGGHIRGIHQAEWGGNSYIIKGKDNNSPCGLALDWVGDNNRGSAYGKAIVVENVFEELDSPMEWFYNKEEKTIYWYPSENTDIAEVEISVSVNTELLTVCGVDPEHPVSSISIIGITFTETSKTLFPVNCGSKAFVPLLRGDWCVVRSGAVFLKNTRDCKILDCSFLSLGGNGLFLSGYQESNLISHNTFGQIGASAIQLVGEPSAVRQPSFWKNDLYPSLDVHQNSVAEPDAIGACGEEYPRDVVISENHIYGVGLLEKQSSGINLSITSRIKIINNTIYNSARSLINVNDGTFGGHEIAGNDLFNAQMETADHGPFNSWGRDRFWSVPKYNAGGKWGEQLRQYKVGEKCYDITRIDAYQTTEIHHNRFYHNPSNTHSWGIDLDDGSTNYQIHHNLVLGIGIKLREGFDRKVYNNLLVDGQLNIHVPYAGARDEIYDNLIYHCQPVALAGCNKHRFRQSEIKLSGNQAYAGGSKIKTPSFVPKFFVHKNLMLQNNGLVVPKEWQGFISRKYGQTDCLAKPPDFVVTFGKGEMRDGFWLMGAKCSFVNQGIRSSTALPDNNGIYIQFVFPFTTGAKLGLQPRDVIRKWNGEEVAIKPQGKPVKLSVWRENQEIDLK